MNVKEEEKESKRGSTARSRTRSKLRSGARSRARACLLIHMQVQCETINGLFPAGFIFPAAQL